MHPHEHQGSLEFGRSPGNGITPIPLSRDPLATEGEATPGPDDYNPYEEREAKAELDAQANPDPTAGDDPFVFDDVEPVVDDLRLPGMDRNPPEVPRF